jgi:hypothetical protein
VNIQNIGETAIFSFYFKTNRLPFEKTNQPQKYSMFPTLCNLADNLASFFTVRYQVFPRSKKTNTNKSPLLFTRNSKPVTDPNPSNIILFGIV